MSTIYLAEDPTLPQWDALKVLSAEMARNPAVRTRFLHEGEITARLAHPNVVAVYGRGETEDGQLWIAMAIRCGHRCRGRLAGGCHDPHAGYTHRR